MGNEPWQRLLMPLWLKQNILNCLHCHCYVVVLCSSRIVEDSTIMKTFIIHMINGFYTTSYSYTDGISCRPAHQDETFMFTHITTNTTLSRCFILASQTIICGPMENNAIRKTNCGSASKVKVKGQLLPSYLRLLWQMSFLSL